MFSVLDPTFYYDDVSPDITENDIDVVSDLWNMDGREVYRGSRDPRYTHANVYWLYDEDLQRVGCAEHSVKDHADVRLLWFRESDFGTLFQEDWEIKGDLWSVLPKHVFEQFLNEGWTTPEKFLERCLHGSLRIVTPNMIINPPKVYVCNACNRRSLIPTVPCPQRETTLDYPDKTKIFFVDQDMILHVPPRNSKVWLKLQLPYDDWTSSEFELEEPKEILQQPELPTSGQTLPLVEEQPSLPLHLPEENQSSSSPHQSHQQTPEQQSIVEEVQL